MNEIVTTTRNMAKVVVARTHLRLQAAVLVFSVAVRALTVLQIDVALNDQPGRERRIRSLRTSSGPSCFSRKAALVP
jgi:hypothetical protein